MKYLCKPHEADHEELPHPGLMSVRLTRQLHRVQAVHRYQGSEPSMHTVQQHGRHIAAKSVPAAASRRYVPTPSK